ncbi:baseplate wedge subunit [Escherichia phage vB_EcoM_005]|uniref:Baseplate wedge subunit n=1 Tax=Escherichia phage vB_EcoM_005 TaxID=2500761 RepID=A0A3T0ILJ8_9CAUD|nr:baseplate wedge subunit [Escherichia phage vB_EcoM_005]AZV00927.1 baseplate wedge subunit [Escherichia phage vB_EcoM_005]
MNINKMYSDLDPEMRTSWNRDVAKATGAQNITPLITDTIKRNIVSAVRNFEPRISALAVGVTPVYDDNSIIVTVQFSIVDDPDTLEQIRIQLSQSG